MKLIQTPAKISNPKFFERIHEILNSNDTDGDQNMNPYSIEYVETLVFQQANVHVSSDHIGSFQVFADIYQVVEHIPILEPWEPVPICGQTHDDRMSYVVIGSNSATDVAFGLENIEIVTLDDFHCDVPVQIEAEIPGALATGQGILNSLSALKFHIKLDKIRLTAT